LKLSVNPFMGSMNLLSAASMISLESPSCSFPKKRARFSGKGVHFSSGSLPSPRKLA